MSQLTPGWRFASSFTPFTMLVPLKAIKRFKFSLTTSLKVHTIFSIFGSYRYQSSTSLPQGWRVIYRKQITFSWTLTLKHWLRHTVSGVFKCFILHSQRRNWVFKTSMKQQRQAKLPKWRETLSRSQLCRTAIWPEQAELKGNKGGEKADRH